MKKYYLAYGSNLSVDDMKYRCPSARIVETTYLNKTRLVFKGENDNYAYLTLEDDEHLMVPLGVYEIEDDNDFKRLDIYEGYPTLYEKRIIYIQLNGELVKGLIYVMRDNYNYHLPSTLYLRTCMKGYQDFEFNKDILIRALEDTKKEMAKDISKIKIK